MKRYRAIILALLCVMGCAAGQVADGPPEKGLKPGEFHWAERDGCRATPPDAFETRALTPSEKFGIFERDAVNPLTFLSAGVTAGYNTINERVYGSGWDGFGKNYGSAIAEHETSSFLGNYLFPTLLNQDPRFHPSGKDGFWKRSTFAASRVLITRNDAGKRTINTSYLLGVLVSTAIGNLYRPPRYRSVGQTWMDFGSTVGGDAGTNVVKEFWPEISKRLKPITPKRLRKLEDSLIGYPTTIE